MKADERLRKTVGTENPFRVPEGYFENFAQGLMEQLPEKAQPDASWEREPTRWERIRPWLYMAAMFVGAALIIRVASSRQLPASDLQASEEAEAETEYIHMAMESSMLDDYSLYVYLDEADTE